VRGDIYLITEWHKYHQRKNTQGVYVLSTSTEKKAFAENAYETTPTVSIVVPCRNEKDHIENAVESILGQEPPPGGFEIIIADGASDDGTRSILARLAEEKSQLHIVDNPRGIVSTGLNQAIRIARGKIIIRMDAHTTYGRDYVRQCVELLTETGADNVGGPWVAKGKGRVGKAISAAFQSTFATGGARGHDPNYSGPVDTVYLGCWRRELFDRIGFFDENFVRNQDDELNLRLARSGGKIWQSTKIKSWYSPRENLLQLFGQYVQYGYWKARIIQKHCLPTSVRHIVPAFFVLMLLVLLGLSVFSVTAFWVWIALLACYLTFNLSASATTAAYNGWKLFPLLPPVFAAFHLAYGWGFLKGFTDFIILRRNPPQSYSALTRSEGET
jgi:glycosyltransferase involved in cell wall biosynthesis